jgi:Tfp pilus assembly protein PilX
MSSYLPAIVIAVVALLALALLVTRTVVTVRRFTTLYRAYQRQLAAESALLAHRQAGLRTELAHRGARARQGTPRTML